MDPKVKIDFEVFRVAAHEAMSVYKNDAPGWSKFYFNSPQKPADGYYLDSVGWKAIDISPVPGSLIWAFARVCPAVRLDGNILVYLGMFQPNSVFRESLTGTRSYIPNPRAWLAIRQAKKLIGKPLGYLEVELTYELTERHGKLVPIRTVHLPTYKFVPYKF